MADDPVIAANRLQTAEPLTTTEDPQSQTVLEVKEKIKWFLDRVMQSFTKKAGETVKFVCGHSITNMALKRLPNPLLFWTHNSDSLNMDPSRMVFYKNNMEITELTPSDSGIYTCSVSWTYPSEDGKGGSDNTTIGVYSLQVTTENPTIFTFAHEPLKLRCHSAMLGFLFPSSTRYWLHNGTDVLAPASTLASNSTSDVIWWITPRWKGVWSCHVSHSRSNRVWNTSWIYVAVDGSPSLFALAYRFVLQHWFYFFFFGIFFTLVTCIFFVYTTRSLSLKEQKYDEEFLQQRTTWEKRLVNSAGKGRVSARDFLGIENSGSEDIVGQIFPDDASLKSERSASKTLTFTNDTKDKSSRREIDLDISMDTLDDINESNSFTSHKNYNKTNNRMNRKNYYSSSSSLSEENDNYSYNYVKSEPIHKKFARGRDQRFTYKYKKATRNKKQYKVLPQTDESDDSF